MAPQKKSKELVEKFRKYVINDIDGENDFVFSYEEQTKNAKQCALIAVDEILIVCNNEISHCSDKTYFYWEQVKQEIELL